MVLVTRESTQANLFRDNNTPDDKSRGNVWIDTSTTKPRMFVANGTAYETIGIPAGGASVPQEAAI